MLIQLRREYLRSLNLKRDKSGDIVVPKPISPRSQAVSYVTLVTQQQRRINDLLDAATQRILLSYATTRQDATEEEVEDEFTAAEAAILALLASDLFAEKVRDIGLQVFGFNHRKYERGIYGTIGINRGSSFLDRDMLGSWVNENVSLVKNLNASQASRLKTTILRAHRTGMSKSALAMDIKNTLGVSMSRAALIATDQVYKLDGQLDRQKQKNIGLNRYKWWTMLDGRVRPSHRARHGKVYSWDSDGPHPGQEVGCRCVGEPHLEDLFE